MNKEMNKEINKDINKEMDKGRNKEINKGMNKEMNKEINKDMKKEMNKETIKVVLSQGTLGGRIDLVGGGNITRIPSLKIKGLHSSPTLERREAAVKRHPTSIRIASEALWLCTRPSWNDFCISDPTWLVYDLSQSISAQRHLDA